MLPKRCATALAVLMLSGCGSSAPTTVEPVSSPEPATAASALDDAVAEWERLGSDRYLVVVSQTDRSPDGGCSWITEVHGAVVDSRWWSGFDNDCSEWDVSVPALHQQIAIWSAEIEEHAGTLQVVWSDSGVPMSIELDRDDASEELSLVVDFEDLTGETSVRTELADARTRWSVARIGSYRMEVSESRNYWSSGCRWVTVITDGVLTDASVDPASTSSYCSEIEWSVEQLHDMIAQWADTIDQYSDPEFGEHTLEVTFDEIGVPQSLVFDLVNGADEESSLEVSLTAFP